VILAVQQKAFIALASTGDGDGGGEARAMATAVTSLGGSGGGNGGDSTATNVCDAILPWYADVINVESKEDGDRVPAIDGGNIDGGVVNFDGMQRACGGQQ
jgi:hypothetical protein